MGVVQSKTTAPFTLLVPRFVQSVPPAGLRKSIRWIVFLVDSPSTVRLSSPRRGSHISAQGRGRASPASFAVALGADSVRSRALKGRNKGRAAAFRVCFALSGLASFWQCLPRAALRGYAASLCPGLIYCCPCRGEGISPSGPGKTDSLKTHRRNQSGAIQRGNATRIACRGGWHESPRQWASFNRKPPRPSLCSYLASFRACHPPSADRVSLHPTHLEHSERRR